MNPKTIVYGTAAILVLYFVAKSEASNAIDKTIETVNAPFKATGNAIGSTLFKVLNPFSPGGLFYSPPVAPKNSPIDSFQGTGGSNGNTK